MDCPHISATAFDWLKLITWLSFITCSSYVHAEEPSHYFNFPMTSTENLHTPQGDEQTPPRLQYLKLDLNPSDPDDLDLAPAPSDDLNYGLYKRVFCNGFTGCGGRFRNRRRKPKADVKKEMKSQSVFKRPFCNSHGCYNSGKRTAGDVPVEEAKSGNFLDDEISAPEGKRLFCNGYGGCQNMGKRLLLLERLRDETKPLADRPSGLEGKRFYTGGFDDEMDDLNNKMGR